MTRCNWKRGADLRSGLEFQANFVWEKWLSDAPGTYQNRFDPFMDINNTAIERSRVPVDLTYQFKAQLFLRSAVWGGTPDSFAFLGQDHRRMDDQRKYNVDFRASVFDLFGTGHVSARGFSGDNEAITLENMSQLEKPDHISDVGQRALHRAGLGNRFGWPRSRAAGAAGVQRPALLQSGPRTSWGHCRRSVRRAADIQHGREARPRRSRSRSA